MKFINKLHKPISIVPIRQSTGSTGARALAWRRLRIFEVAQRLGLYSTLTPSVAFQKWRSKFRLIITQDLYSEVDILWTFINNFDNTRIEVIPSNSSISWNLKWFILTCCIGWGGVHVAILPCCCQQPAYTTSYCMSDVKTRGIGKFKNNLR